MDYSGLFVRDDNQLNEEKPPARVCPRCNSDNTKFCYYNNYSVSQPRYKCKNCRRYWTHGGTLRNVPIGGSGRKIKRTMTDQPSISQVVSVENHQFNHHQPFLHDQETNGFVGSSAAAAAVRGNHFGSLLEFHGNMVTNVPPFGNFPPMEASHISDVLFGQGSYNVGYSDLIGNPMVNQIAGGSVVVSSDQEAPNMWNMDHNASTSGSKGHISKH
ncbi:unnamed protein product [Eruca vesicaria subsp. sativa]|uniref:Dof zinc finger protein n=1 Tax=Eruca vesicaria subsp. sativa TaxID=29727 RepID=A0ABC8JWY2_ERUVS|nr:unnamed protein product [Eruca vesicaria subsp. sativa]